MSGRVEIPGIIFANPKHVLGPLDFSLTGIMSRLSGCLTDAGISLFTLSTFDTDWILVKSDKKKAAEDAWRKAGYIVL